MAQVKWWIADGLAWVLIDALPVNALSGEVRTGLLDAACSIAAQGGVLAVILHSAGPVFCAGADIRELGLPSRAPSLPDVISAIETSPVPWVAAIQGAALGGGLELAIACAGRISGSAASFGLPEVSIGVIPGAGGTVRLPRLVPMKRAIEMVTSGKSISVTQALDGGLVDLVSEADLLERASHYAKKLSQTAHSRTLDKPLRDAQAIDWPAETGNIRAKSRGAQAPLEALAALEAAARLPATAALADARKRFLRLGTSTEAAALRHVFKAERSAGSTLRGPELPVVKLDSAGVVGGGTMGAGIATALLLAGLRVHLLEQTDMAASQAQERILKLIEAGRERGIVSAAAARDAMSSLKVGSNYEELAHCDLVIEAVFEDMAAKQAVFSSLDAVVAPETILASNTSYLDVDDLAARTRHPERVIGLHFFAPAHVMKLLEVIRGRRTGDRALAMAGVLAKRLKKTAVVSGVCDGFIGNRIMAAYRRACESMLEQGALPHEIDAAMQAFGFAMGIFQVQDLSGLDIGWAQRKARRASGTLSAGEGRIADQLCEMGRLGRKTGRGWYRYEDGKQLIDDEVHSLIEETSKASGTERRALCAEEIINRILAVMQNEGQAILSEGIAQSADDIDIVMIAGYGFPRHKGGPMFMAALQPLIGQETEV